jgi:hypothetical protein
MKTLNSVITGTVSHVAMLFVTLFAGLSLIVFIFGATKYIFRGDSEGERKKGKTFMLWGIIGFFVMFGVWGIVEILAQTFGIDATIPQF